MTQIGKNHHTNLNIGNGQQSSVSSEESGKSIRHFPSTISCDTIEIKLNIRNSSHCNFPNRQKGIVLWDSGATFSLISEGAINDNTYLKNIKPVSIPDTKFMVGDGNFINSSKSLTFNMEVNGNIFQLTAHVVPSLGGITVIVGTQSVKELEADSYILNITF